MSRFNSSGKKRESGTRKSESGQRRNEIFDSEDTEEEEDQFQIFAYLGTKKKVDDEKLNKLIDVIDVDGNG